MGNSCRGNPRREKLSNSVQNSPRSNEIRRANVSVPNSPRQIRMDMMAGSKNSTDGFTRKRLSPNASINGKMKTKRNSSKPTSHRFVSHTLR
ncbi:unnamed protein product [Caenorhabditis angaria]|uniref:Uncharacterized protein n=1 Tax=Caenorhabditis angaria TaxID=860376 RepID=A0A9P1N602_9PELO|nr:unnamed protein product [Caenorhabditis angaria]